MTGFISRRHAQNVAAELRRRADENRDRADVNERDGDALGKFICLSNARVAEARAKLADEAAELLGDPGDGAA